MNIIDSYLPINQHSRPGTKIKPTKIAVHYVGNAGSSAKGNRNYFASGKVYASSHYIIGLDGEILKLIPEDEISYCTNQANSYTISIECCHPDSNGKFNDKTLNALIELCTDICKRHGFNPLTSIIRHYDVTKKCCPKWWSPNGPNPNANNDFNNFKQQVKNKMNNVPVNPAKKETKTFEFIKANILNKNCTFTGFVENNENWIKISDALKVIGYDVKWNNIKKRAIAVKNNKEILLDIRTYISVDNISFSPLRDLYEYLGFTVTWNKTNGIIVK